MRGAGPREAARIRSAVATAAEEVFETVRGVRDDALDWHQDAIVRAGRVTGRDISQLRPRIQARLRREGGLVLGLGLIVAPGLLSDEPLRLEWWQSDPGRGALAALNVDLKRTSLGFYDYTTADWFDVPRQSGARHVVGPYVDVHGTGRYVLTFTMPVESGGRFLGVAGADVSSSRFENRLLGELGPDADAVLLNAEHRVVFSTSPLWLAGALIDPDAAVGDAVAEQLPGLPWELRCARDLKPLTL